MTLRELIIGLLEEYEENNILDKELAFFEKDNPDGTLDVTSIKGIGISDNYIVLANKCPNCDNLNFI